MTGASSACALRRAALSLHALDKEDREWILRALPGHQSTRLRGLLQELHELGIPTDGMPLQAWIDAPTAVPADVFPPFSPAVMQQLVRLLAAEPPRVRDVLLPRLPREWRRGLSDAEGSFSGAQLARGDHAPALQAAVLDAVRRRLAATASPDRTSGMWQRLAGRFGKARRL